PHGRGDAGRVAARDRRPAADARVRGVPVATLVSGRAVARPARLRTRADRLARDDGDARDRPRAADALGAFACGRARWRAPALPSAVLRRPHHHEHARAAVRRRPAGGGAAGGSRGEGASPVGSRPFDPTVAGEGGPRGGPPMSNRSSPCRALVLALVLLPA